MVVQSTADEYSKEFLADLFDMFYIPCNKEKNARELLLKHGYIKPSTKTIKLSIYRGYKNYNGVAKPVIRFSFINGRNTTIRSIIIPKEELEHWRVKAYL